MVKQRRKLVRKAVLDKVDADFALGVPLLRLLRDYELNISTTHIKKLIEFNRMLADPQCPNIIKLKIEESLKPQWLDQYGEDVQIQPWDNYRYVGQFPIGQWVEL